MNKIASGSGSMTQPAAPSAMGKPTGPINLGRESPWSPFAAVINSAVSKQGGQQGPAASDPRAGLLQRLSQVKQAPQTFNPMSFYGGGMK